MRVNLAARLGDREVGDLGISSFGFGISFLGLGNDIIGLKGSLWALGLWQEIDLLALALSLILSHLSLLVLVTSLTRPFGYLSRRKGGLGGGGLLREGLGKGSRRGECSWNLTDICRVEDILSFPSLRGGRDSYQVEGFHPYLLIVTPADQVEGFHPSFFMDKKSSSCLMSFKAAIAFSKKRGCSRASLK